MRHMRRSRQWLASCLACSLLATLVAAQRVPVQTVATPPELPVGTMVVGQPGARTPEGFSLAPWALPLAEEGAWGAGVASEFGARFDHRVSAVGARLFVTGGADANYVVTNQVDVFEPSSGEWKGVAPMIQARASHAAVCIGRRVFVFGGIPASGSGVAGIRESEVYDPDTDAWSPIASMPTARAVMRAVVVGGNAYVIGGGSAPGVGNDLGVVEVYDPVSDAWSTRSPLPTPRAGSAIVVSDDRIHVFGGEIYVQQAPNALHDVYDPATDTWTVGAPLPNAVNLASAVRLGSRIYVLGGNPPDGAEVQVFDTKTSTWSVEPSMPGSHFLGDAVAVRGRVYVVEGVPWDHLWPKTQQGVLTLDYELPLFLRD